MDILEVFMQHSVEDNCMPGWKQRSRQQRIQEAAARQEAFDERLKANDQLAMLSSYRRWDPKKQEFYRITKEQMLEDPFKDWRAKQ